ncbi:NAD-dependent deacylase [Corynebacterium cystitidis]|uniref:NAD-dependent protein deacylase n=1 Tax=Corynebacterium cystitidis DSM 20524 TaxID=1121357 RepID=A0A1H9VWM8_9CORY|nr:NAD-dependent protein deacylase [Corynebacterium cystitidis DSM 20524]SES25703.1 NAD-dependent deacetylase [Corynebacterium cystitidis DSM 20524]SNV89831.1 NAD-dependent deacetylase [Corynebacterium cystitidis]
MQPPLEKTVEETVEETVEQAAEQAQALVANARHIEVFTGAGMSADSGIATFRDAQTGLWENVDPTALASIDAWAQDPEPMWAWYLWRAHLVNQAEPNAGHRAIADWGMRSGTRNGAHHDVKVTVTTQNIDNLHERAGSSDVAHLHGSLFHYRCSICSRPWKAPVELPDEPVERLTPPTCPLCGNLVRPGVVWFGEALPPREWEKAEQRMNEADLVVIVGTSGVVYPAAGLPVIAYQRGTPIIEVTPKRTDLSTIASVVVETTAAQGLPRIFSDA